MAPKYELIHKFAPKILKRVAKLHKSNIDSHVVDWSKKQKIIASENQRNNNCDILRLGAKS